MKTKLAMTTDGNANLATSANWLVYVRPYAHGNIVRVDGAKVSLRREIYGPQAIFLPDNVNTYMVVPR